MKLFFRIAVIMLICIGLLWSASACTLRVSAESLSKKYKPKKQAQGQVEQSHVVAAYQLALNLLEHTEGTSNRLFSPLSVLLALGMTANGANGDTKAQMEATLGMTSEEANRFLSAVLREADEDVLKIAQSVWFRDKGLSVSPDFLQTNADYYGADAYAAPFDQSTVKDINRWVNHYTDGMIEKLLDGIDASSMMYLISALAFDAKWDDAYKKDQVKKALFTHLDGSTEEVDMMSSTENQYLSLGEAVGLLKYYEGGRYAFAGILPPKGMSPESYLASLSAEDFTALLQNPQFGTVDAEIPAFSFSCEYLLNDTLQSLGMSLPFSDKADFSKIDGSTSLYISQVLHKTFIDVSPDGTRAAAVTSVGLNKCAVTEPEGTVYVHLDRPFVMVLLDTSTGLPIFVGTVNQIH